MNKVRDLVEHLGLKMNNRFISEAREEWDTKGFRLYGNKVSYEE